MLTHDYERIDFVLVEKLAPRAESGQTIGQRQVSVRPRSLTVERRNPTKVDLRVLRRLSYTEPDPIAQYDKLKSAFDIAYWSADHFNNRALFADYYLSERLQEHAEWKEDAKPIFLKLRTLYDRTASRWAGKSERDLRSGLLEPVLGELGFHAERVKPAGDDRPEPDYRLRTTDGTLVALCLAYRWGRFLDGKDEGRDTETPEENPGAVVVSLLERGEAPFAVVTNGKHWRLYAAKTHSRATNYYEIDLEETLALDDPNDPFRYFWLLFRRQAMEPRDAIVDGEPTRTTFVEEILRQSEQYAKQLGERLKDRVFEEIFPHFADGFIADIRTTRSRHAGHEAEDRAPARRGLRCGDRQSAVDSPGDDPSRQGRAGCAVRGGLRRRCRRLRLLPCAWAGAAGPAAIAGDDRAEQVASRRIRQEAPPVPGRA